jgi:hypothetical protein
MCALLSLILVLLSLLHRRQRMTKALVADHSYCMLVVVLTEGDRIACC